jgi:hypothetical protein
MALAEFIVAKLTGDSTVFGYVGQKVFASIAIQDMDAPFVLFDEFDGDRYSSMGSDADICDCRVRFHIYHKNYADAVGLATALRKCLQRYRGTLASTTVDDIFTEAGGPNLFDAETKTFHLVRDFRIIYRET